MNIRNREIHNTHYTMKKRNHCICLSLFILLLLLSVCFYFIFQTIIRPYQYLHSKECIEKDGELILSGGSHLNTMDVGPWRHYGCRTMDALWMSALGAPGKLLPKNYLCKNFGIKTPYFGNLLITTIKNFPPIKFLS